MNLHGPVRASEGAGPGVATLTIALDGWADGGVAPTKHPLFVIRPKGGPTPEPVSPKLVKTLVHPDKRANMMTLRFSPDGGKLLAPGYPSGVVQLWDAKTWTELRRIEAPRGYRGSADYAVVSPDWATLYVPIEWGKPVHFEQDGKKKFRREYNGAVRVWDLATGKERPPLDTPGRGPYQAVLSPDGKTMVTPMGRSGDDKEREYRSTEIWDVAARTSRPLCPDRYAVSAFAPDGRVLAYTTSDHDGKTSTLVTHDVATGKELARFEHKGDGRTLSGVWFDKDGRTLFTSVGGKKGAAPTLFFLDARTLAKVGELVGEPDPDHYGWFGATVVGPAGDVMAAVARAGTVKLYDLRGRKLLRTYPLGDGLRLWQAAFSPDGKRLYVGAQPTWDEKEYGDEPDPADLPQPRVFVLDLTADTAEPAEVLVAPPGYLGAIAVSPDGRTVALGSAGGVHLFDVTRK